MHVTLLPPEPEAPPTPSLPAAPEMPPWETTPPLPDGPEVPPWEMLPSVPAGPRVLPAWPPLAVATSPALPLRPELLHARPMKPATKMANIALRTLGEFSFMVYQHLTPDRSG